MTTEAAPGSDEGTPQGTNEEEAPTAEELLGQLSGLQNQVSKLRKERNQFKTQAEELASKTSDAAAQSGDVTKLASDRDAWKTKYEELVNQQAAERKEAAVKAAARKLNFIDEELPARYLDLSELEDDSDIEKAVKKLAKDKPKFIADQEEREEREDDEGVVTIGSPQRPPVGEQREPQDERERVALRMRKGLLGF